VGETLNLSELHGYRTGGTVHVIVNNQIGFTTPPEDSRSTRYCTDVAKMLESPIFHVNGHDPEAVAHVVAVAMDYRARFHNDVVIDVWGFRKYGHNEADEPAFTQPVLYRRIAEMPSVFAAYGECLSASGVVSPSDLQGLGERWRAELESEWADAKRRDRRHVQDSLGGVWRGFAGGLQGSVPEPETTGVALPRLVEIATGMATLPEGFAPHPKIQRLLENRVAMATGQRPVDWATAELLAFGSLVREGRFVRLSGQDSGRGTFSQRHAALADQRTGEDYVPLQHLHPDQAPFRVYDSPLSEAAVLGFELGFSLDYPEALVLWEAQFGDFVNGAQVLIDQFLAAAEDKWRRLSGLVLLLPHGYEGQGPEHSSARLERFLQLCAEDNLIVAQPSTPAQQFHLLRRQTLWKWKKPLVVMTPKSLLRLPAAGSPIASLATGRFARVLGDRMAPADARRVLLCSGKVYYDLAEERARRRDARTAIVRVEQLYPWPAAELGAVLVNWPGATDVAWVQEEPANMGALRHVLPRLQEALARPIRPVSRLESASTATGSAKAHVIEQRALLAEAFQGSG
jgi:2-oxoglutarate dehydrogenase E1 component